MANVCSSMELREGNDRYYCTNDSAKSMLGVKGEMFCPYTTICRMTGKYKPSDYIARYCKAYK